mgnify:CR=1 FL=1
MNEIIPAILPKDAADLVAKAEALPLEIPFIHLDVLEEDIWADISKDFEAHLMVENPRAIMDRWIERGAKRLIIHKPDADIAKYRDRAEIGLAAEMDTPLESVLPFVDFVDFIHLMSIDEIGVQGNPLDEKIFDRIKAVRKQFPEIPISVDGGITVDNFKKLQEAGATRLIVGSHFKEIWNSLTKN